MGCVFIHVVTTVITRFCCVCFFNSAANEAGETPLDIARRLKHVQCEELVSSTRFNLTTCVCEREPFKNSLVFVCVCFIHS